MEYILLIVLSVIASFIQGVSGMGHAIVVMSIATLFFPYIELVVSIKLMSFVFFLPVLFMVKKIKWKLLIMLVAFSYVGSYFGTELLNLVESQYLIILLGVLMLVFGSFSLLQKKNLEFKPTWYIAGFVGVVSGFCSAVASMAGPPLAMYYINIKELSDDKDAYYATMMTTYQCFYTQQLISLEMDGAIPPQSYVIFLVSFIPLLVGILLGRKWVKKANIDKIKKSVYLLMTIMGLYLIISNTYPLLFA